MVTGATDGIGLGRLHFFVITLGYVKRLAARGINVVLVSRSQERLDVSAKEVMEKYHVSFKTVCNYPGSDPYCCF